MAIDFSKPVRTKGGESVRILCTDGNGKYPVIGIVGSAGSATIWTIDGRYYSAFEDSLDDLENVPEEKTYHTVFFPSRLNDIVSITYKDLAVANLDDAIAIYKVTTVDGEITRMEGVHL